MRNTLHGLALASTLAITAQAQADVVTLWDFNSAVADASTSTGNLMPSLGAGTAATVGGTSASFSAGAGSSDPAGAGLEHRHLRGTRQWRQDPRGPIQRQHRGSQGHRNRLRPAPQQHQLAL